MLHEMATNPRNEGAVAVAADSALHVFGDAQRQVMPEHADRLVTLY